MNGSEKQIKWATELKKSVNDIIDQYRSHVTGHPDYIAHKQEAENFLSIWDDRKNKLNACTDAKFIIDFFKDLRAKGSLEQNFIKLNAIYITSANNGYPFK